MPETNPKNSLKQLSFLIGKWNSHGMTIRSEGNPAVVISGTDTYEWGLEGCFIVHTVEVHMGGEKVEAIEFAVKYDDGRDPPAGRVEPEDLLAEPDQPLADLRVDDHRRLAGPEPTRVAVEDQVVRVLDVGLDVAVVDE